jgi:hypothetical protein
VATGARNATVVGDSSARQADRISRQIAAVIAGVSGPAVASPSRRRISASRSGA